jgi:hypothetical protein
MATEKQEEQIEKAGVECLKCKGTNTFFTGNEHHQDSDYEGGLEPCEAYQCWCKDCGEVFWD